VGLSFGVEVIIARLSAAKDIDTALNEFAVKPGGGLIVMPTIINLVERERLTARAASLRLPAI
jgi:putative ABC transport system substrate-binding protein